MFKNSSMLIIVIGILAISTSALSMNKSENGIIHGKITGIKGNVITIRDNKGGELLLVVKSTAGIKIGAPALCEEDCGYTLKSGNTVVNVQKVLKQNLRTSDDPHINQKAIK